VRSTVAGIAAILALAGAAFAAAYFGGGALSKSPPVENAGAAVKAPALAVNGTMPALRTPTPTPSPSPTATPKPKKKKKKTVTPRKTAVPPRATVAVTSVPTRVATRVPTRVATQAPAPPKKKKPTIIIED